VKLDVHVLGKNMWLATPENIGDFKGVLT